MGRRSYIDTQFTDAMEIPRLVATVSDSEIDDDEAKATSRLAADGQLRKKLRMPHGGETSRR